MKIFEKFIKKKCMAVPQIPPEAPAPRAGYFKFEPGVLPAEDCWYSEAYFEDGVVYFNFPFGRAAIGFYEEGEDGTTRILCDFDRSEIGHVDEDGTLWLSRSGLYRRFSKSSFIKIPKTLLLQVGRFYGEAYGFLDQAGNHSRLGIFSGNKAGAAAAFTCLVYECHSRYEYRSFFDRSNWD